MTDDDQILRLLRLHARTPIAWQILNPGLKRWLSPDRSAAAGYTLQSGTRITAGPPVTAPGNIADAARAFEAAAARAGQSVCYFGAEALFVKIMGARRTHRTVLLGAQPAWHPARWAETMEKRRSARELILRASRKTDCAEEISAEAARTDADCRRCLETWRSSRPLPPLGFVLHPDVLTGSADRRYFALRSREGITAFASVVPIAGRNGWLIETIARGSNAAAGSGELLIDTVMRTAAREGAEYITLGLAPLSQKARISYAANPLWLRAAFGFFYAAGSGVYNFPGLDAFKSKLAPDRWEPVYAVVNRPRFSPRMLGRVARAFAGGSIKKFAAATLERAYHGAVKNE